jgi:HTH-like domain
VEVRCLLEEFKSSERHVCELMAVPRSSGRYRSRRDDSQIQERLRELAREHPRFGYRRLHLYLCNEIGVNHKRVRRVYRKLGLTVERMRRKHLRRTLSPRPVLRAPNQEWASDFAIDVTAAGQRFRVLGVIDSFTPQCLALEVTTSFPAHRPHSSLGYLTPDEFARRCKAASLSEVKNMIVGLDPATLRLRHRHLGKKSRKMWVMIHTPNRTENGGRSHI